MSKLLKIMGQIFIVIGIILGIFYGFKDNPLAVVLRIDDDGFKWLTAIAWWVSGAISGILFLGLAEILEYVEANNAHLRELLHRTYKETSTTTTPKSSSKPKPSLGSLNDYKMSSHD